VADRLEPARVGGLAGNARRRAAERTNRSARRRLDDSRRSVLHPASPPAPRARTASRVPNACIDLGRR
jgi:hypothetical protein